MEIVHVLVGKARGVTMQPDRGLYSNSGSPGIRNNGQEEKQLLGVRKSFQIRLT